MAAPRGQRLIALDGLRGVAAIAVLFEHAEIGFLPPLHAYLAVDFFFLLSGYVIARGYEAQLGAGLSLARYASIRMARLYPMLLLGGVLGLALFWTYAPDGYFIPDRPFSMALAVFSQFSLLPFLASQGAFVFNGAQWSVVLEILVNLVHAILLRVLSNAALILLVAANAAALCYVAKQHHTLNLGWGLDNVLDGIPRVGFGFFAGVLLYRLRPIWQRLVPQLHFGVIALGLLIVITSPEWPVFRLGSRDAVSALVAFPLIIMLGAKARGWPSFAAALGTLSYPLYAIHTPLLFGMIALTAWLGLAKTGSGDALMTAGNLGIIGAAYLVGRWVDEPLNARRRRARRTHDAGVTQEQPAAASSAADA